MLKRIWILMTVGLFVIVSARIATALTTLDNGISKFVLNDYGVVIEAYYLPTNTGNLLDANANKGLNFGMYSPDITSTSDTIWMDEMITCVTQVASNEYRFSGTRPFMIGATPISLSYMVNVKLQHGKPYLDLRYDIQVSPTTINRVAFYFYKEPKDSLSLLASNETAGASNWQMVNDIPSSWFGMPNWPSPVVVYTAGNVVGLNMKKGDDAVGGEASNVWNWVNSGGIYLPGVKPPVGTSVSPSDPAWGIKFPYSKSQLYYTLQSGKILTMEARLETAPEPATICLMLTGLLGIAGAARRRFSR